MGKSGPRIVCGKCGTELFMGRCPACSGESEMAARVRVLGALRQVVRDLGNPRAWDQATRRIAWERVVELTIMVDPATVLSVSQGLAPSILGFHEALMGREHR